MPGAVSSELAGVRPLLIVHTAGTFCPPELIFSASLLGHRWAHTRSLQRTRQHHFPPRAARSCTHSSRWHHCKAS